jgi:hypothetical protein
MIINLSHANRLGKLLFSSTSINKGDFLTKLKNHVAKDEILAHLVNFKMHCASENNDIEKQNSELKHIEEILRWSYNKEITFDEVQKFVHNRSMLSQRQLPSQFKEVILELVNSKNSENCYDFVRHLSGDSYSFLQTNGINISTVIISSIEYCSTITPNGHARSHDEALALLKKFGSQLNVDVRNTLVITLIKNCSGIDSYSSIDPYGYVLSASIALKLLKKYWGQLGNDVRNTLVITLIKNCSGINSYGNVHSASMALELLEEYGDQLGNDVHNTLVITLIKNCSGIDSCSSIDPYGNVLSASIALKLLGKYGNQLGNDVRNTLVITLIENCSGIDSDGDLHSAYMALKLLEKYGNQLGNDVRNTLVITLIGNCSSTNTNGSVLSASIALKLLEKYWDQLGNDVRNTLVITLIENCSGIDSCSSIDSDGDALSASIALKLLGKYGNQLGNDVRNTLVITLIKNCSGIDSNGSVRMASTALELLEEYEDQLGNDVRNTLVITLIKNCSGIDSDGDLHSAYMALKLLEKYGNQLDDNIHHSLVITLIENFNGINRWGDVHDRGAAMELLNENKPWLMKGEYREFYKRTAENLFTSAEDYQTEILTQLLEIHGEVISAEAILNKYRQTDSIRVIQAIRAYVQGAGQYRRINLPPRLDMQVNGRPLAGIAFEVHNFTDGIESAALKAMDKFLAALEVPKPKFTIDDLVGKFNLIENEQLRNKANNALNRLLGSESYKEKLELALPTIAAFLSLHHTTWETGYQDANIYWNTLPTDEKVNLALKNHYNDPGSYWQDLTNDQKIDLLRELRWSMWLTQSFVEAGNAYSNGTDSTSCVKGVYERLFTGFRGMHPLIDCLFVTQTVTKGFNNGITNWLKEIGRVNDIVVKLKAKGLTGTEDEEFFKSELKQAYFQAIKKELKSLIAENLNACFNKLTDFKSLSSYLAEEIKGRKSQIIKDALDKFNVILDYLDAIEVNDKQTLNEYIRQQLIAIHQSFPKSLPELVDE